MVARVCLNKLRSREQRREDPLDSHVPDPIVSPESGLDPQHEVVLADSVGLALQVVLGTLTPAERLAFVLHDMFAVPFDDIAPMIERSPEAARQLASRGRRRVRGQAPAPDPDVVLRSDAGRGPARLTTVTTGARAVAGQAITFGRLFPLARPALINGAAGVVVAAHGRPLSVMSCTVTGGRIAAIGVLADPDRLEELDLTVLDPDVVLRSDGGRGPARLTTVITGARAVAGQAITFGRLFPFARPALVNGAAGVVVAAHGRPLSVMAFTVTGGRIAAIDVLADPDRLEGLDLTVLDL